MDKDMLFRKSPEKFWNLIASKYAASPISDIAAYEKKIEKLKSYLSPEYHVLDIGCGTGTQCDDLANNVKHVTGIDISSKLLAVAEHRKAERKIENVEFIQTTVFDERFEPGSFDLITAFYVLHFYEDIDEVVRRIYSLLKPDGLFVSETACMGDKNILIGKLLRLAGKSGFLPLMSVLTTRQIEQALEQAGFSIVDKTKFSESNDEYTLLAKKL
ncbi:MAG: class I SAM-dependent methyltransferase [Gammaproteobacteria bacterium]|nr:class I SAM-dependent methyltransferase [Gammaproteobacteria bacterium]